MRNAIDTSLMTNRELYTEYERHDARTGYLMLREMARRVHQSMITPDVVSIFKQYKLNGAGDQRF